MPEEELMMVVGWGDDVVCNHSIAGGGPRVKRFDDEGCYLRVERDLEQDRSVDPR